MKYRLILLLPFFLFLTACRTQYVNREVVILQPAPKVLPPSYPVKKEPIPLPKTKHIVLDAGHGGKDKGTFSIKNKYEEKERTLKTAKVVKSYLEDMGYHVTMTRESDIFIPLSERAEIANDEKADLFVSIHYNHCESNDVDGIEIFYYKDEKNPFSERILNSKKIGEEVLAKIKKHTGANSRGVKKANFAVIRETKMPAILIEAGFLSNPEEREKIKEESYICFMAWSIARGIDSYYDKLK